MSALLWRCRDRTFDLSQRTLVMGIVNITPDSFSDGGQFLEPERAIDQAHRLLAEGAELVDLGAESTRPGAMGVGADPQLERLLPVLEELVQAGVTVSVDTANARVAEVALAAGAQAINDVTALGDPAMAAIVAEAKAGLVLMHMRGTPATMQDDPHYDDTAREVREWLAGRLEHARRAGIDEESIVLDPGIGFGKTARHNLELLARIDELAALGRPVLVGASRKSFIGKLLDLPVDQRLEGGLSVAAVAVFMGARIVRTHDVAPTVRSIRIAEAMREARRA